MKKLLLFAFFMLVYMSITHAQWSIGPKAGVNFSYIYNHGNIDYSDNMPVEGTMYAKYFTGFNAGAFARYGLSKRFSIQPELIYSLQGLRLDGANTKTPDGTEQELTAPKEKIQLGYINLPVMVQYRIMMEGLFVEFGAQFGYLVSGKNSKETYDTSGNRTDVTDNIYDELRKFDFSLALGISYEFSQLPLGANVRYTYGLTDVFKDDFKNPANEDKRYTNGVFQAGLFYRFSL